MIVRTIALIGGLLGACTIAAANPFEKGLSGTNVAVYLKNAVALDDDAALVDAPGLDKGITAIRLRYDKELPAEFQAISAEPGKVYHLSFDGRWSNEQTLENNYMYVVALSEMWELALETMPTSHVDFIDAHNKVIEARLLGSMPYGEWKQYSYTFCAPAGTAKIQVRMKSGRNLGEFFVANPKFEKRDGDPDSLVLNFRSNEKGGTGRSFGVLRDGYGRPGAGGSFLVSTGNMARTEMLPLGKPGKYRLVVTGESPVPSSKITLNFHAADRKRIDAVAINDPVATPTEFVLPEGTAGVQLIIEKLWLDEIRIQPVP